MKAIIRTEMMIFITSIVGLLISPYFTLADDSSIKGIEASWFYPYTIGIIIASVLITLVGTGLVYLTFRCLKRHRSQPRYSFDEISIQKDPVYVNENYDAFPSIQPIVTVSEVVSSVKESLEVLGDTITPKRWFTPREK